ncbi:MAG TPA: hypothetical protein VIH88_04780 [Candidatus Acidoferrales bacterium]
MYKQLSWFEGVLIFLFLLLGANSFATSSHSSPVAGLPQSTVPSEKFRFLRKLAQEFSIDHTSRWKHSVSQFGDVTTTISVAPINFDGCSIVWNQMQEGTASGQLIYIETHRFEVPLATMDAKQITIEPVRAGQGERPGIEAGDYYVVRLQTVRGKNTVNVVDQNIVFNRKRGPITSVEQPMVSSAWVRVRTEEQAELLKLRFEQAIGECIATGQ